MKRDRTRWEFRAHVPQAALQVSGMWKRRERTTPLDSESLAAYGSMVFAESPGGVTQIKPAPNRTSGSDAW